MIDTVVEAHQIAINHHKIDIVLTLETDTDMAELLLLHNLTDQDNYRRDSRSHCSPYRSSTRSPYRQDSRDRYISRSYSRDRHFPQYTSSYRPLSQPRPSRPFRSRSGSGTRNKINTIQTEQSNSPINL